MEFDFKLLHDGSSHEVELETYEDFLNKFWLRLKVTGENTIFEERHFEAYQSLLKDMEAFYRHNKNYAKCFVDVPRIGQACAVANDEEQKVWLRGQIIAISPGKPSLFNETGSDKSSLFEDRRPKFQVLIVDNGAKCWKFIDEIRQLGKDFMQLPKQAVLVTLNEIQPNNSRESLKDFSDLATKIANGTDSKLIMSVEKRVSNPNEPIKVTLWQEFEHKRVNLNVLLKWKGFAQVDELSFFCKRIEYFKGTLEMD